MQSCSVKFSFSVQLGRKQDNRNRPVKFIFKSLVNRDSSVVFFTSIEAELKSKIPNLWIAHNRSNAELAMKTKYNALKQKLKENIDAGETGWRIKRPAGVSQD
ncbi:hypothetical protein QYM36_008271 [Artemia franciscana]|uniref:Uncharacterized protein n=1 Tax=Artemia franciscana TaxID=6661 RepID=A0AA88IB02_ARTSF|nr:hypothetical protein QYM36_008271 [Artemia franciscana]